MSWRKLSIRPRNLVEAVKSLALGLQSSGIEEGSALFAVTQSLSAQVKTIGSGLESLRAALSPARVTAKAPLASVPNSGMSRPKDIRRGDFACQHLCAMING